MKIKNISSSEYNAYKANKTVNKISGIKSNRPMYMMCLTVDVIYKATVSHNNKNFIYIGLTSK